MKQINYTRLARNTCKAFTLASLLFTFSNSASAFMSASYWEGLGQERGAYTLDCPHWFVSGNLGAGRAFDNTTPGLGGSVNQYGPAWNVNGGYMWNSMIGGELGYTQYHDSRETAGPVLIAKTEHYMIHLAAVGYFPIAGALSATGKLGVGYSYANKTVLALAAASANSVSPYGALGLAYSLTKKVDLVAQWEGVRGNDSTGSNALYSLGFTFAII